MTLTVAEIEELDRLLEEQRIFRLKKGLTDFTDKTNPNYKELYNAINSQKWGFDENGKPKLLDGYVGAVLEGSSRSGKTWSGVDVIIWLCTEVETNCTINIVRETYAEFKTTLYLDFKQRLDDFNIPNPFHTAQEVKSFKIGKNQINFLGSDKIGKKHGAGSDYIFFNEAMHIPKDVFNQLKMRCNKFWWCDYNPSVTDHYIFDSVIPRPDVTFLRTTFNDNPFISANQRNEILSYEPWLPNSYEVIGSEIFYNGEPISDTNQPPPHPTNVDHGTADEFMWKVYGLGLRGAMKGLVFNNVRYIDEFPDLGYTYGMDFGFTTDPTTLVKYAEDETDIYLELLLYSPTETPEEIDSFLNEIGIEKHLPITADSSDRYTSENNGAVEMVRSLSDLGWSINKVRKKKSVMFWLTSMKKKRINIVKSRLYKEAKKEQENYKMKEINGISINQPEDNYNHFFDGARYAHMSWNEQEYTIHF
ncbi:phage terminase large subunit [Joostella sp. CR20]|uniref:phage terminase large subunit n=1 Tax=Joostella sp. CR20 TaxID=2804312 RepID=UPI00313AFBD0